MSHAAPPSVDDIDELHSPRRARPILRVLGRVAAWVLGLAVVLAAAGWYVLATHPGLREGTLKGGTASGALVTSNLGFDRAYVLRTTPATVSYSIRNTGVAAVTIDGVHRPDVPGFPDTVISSVAFQGAPDALGLPPVPTESVTIEPDQQVLMIVAVELSPLRPAPPCAWSRIDGFDVDVTALGLSSVQRLDVAVPFQWRGYLTNGEGDPGCPT